MTTRFRYSIAAMAVFAALAAIAWGQAPGQGSPPPAQTETQRMVETARQMLNRGDVSRALQAFETALVKAREEKDRMSEARCLLGRAQIRMRVDLSLATKDLEEAKAIFTSLGDLIGLAGVENAMGVYYMGRGEYWNAEKPLTEALRLSEQAGRPQPGVMINLAIVQLSKGEPATSIELLNRAIPLVQASGPRPFEANAYLMLGEAQRLSKQFDASIKSTEKAIAIYKELGMPNVAGATYNIGLVYWDRAEPVQAKAKYVESLSLLGNAPDPVARGRTTLMLGEIALAEGNYREAAEWYQQSLAQFRVTRERPMEGEALKSLGILAVQTGQPGIALGYFEASLKIYQDLGRPSNEAVLLNALGGAYLDMGMIETAIGYLERSADTATKAGQAAVATMARRNAGFGLQDLGRHQEALAAFREGLAGAERDGDVLGTISATSSIGGSLRRLGKPAEALTYSNKALKMLRPTDPANLRAEILFELAESSIALGNLPRANQYYDQVLRITERSRASLGGFEESKSNYLLSVLRYYYGALDLQLRMGNPNKAFEIAQKTKARGLVDLLSAGRVDVTSRLAPSEREELRRLRVKADFLNQQMVKEGVINEPGAKVRYAEFRNQLTQTEAELQRATEAAYARHPGLAARAGAATATVADLAKFLPADTALLDYVVLSGREVVVFVATASRGKATVTAHRLKTSYPQLAKFAADFRNACADPRKDYRPGAKRLHSILVQPVASRLARTKRLIVCPDGGLWDVPFQALLTSSSQSRFLAQQFEIAYAYSATGAQATIAPRSTARKPSRPALVVANPDFGSSKRFGDLDGISGQRPIEPPSRPIEPPSRPIEPPSRPIEPPSRAIEPPSRAFEGLDRAGRIVPLPGTQREADLLRQLFPGSTILTGAAAQENAAKANAGQYRYLHLATHGIYNDAAPWLSSVVLAQPSEGSGEDGFLTARELFDLDLAADMAVLSACNSGRGVERTGEGVLGLTWAIFAAGCPSQVVSQWAVDDASTAQLMENFYRNLATKRMGKAAALRKASVDMMSSPRHRHPYYWAPFILMGNWK